MNNSLLRTFAFWDLSMNSTNRSTNIYNRYRPLTQEKSPGSDRSVDSQGSNFTIETPPSATSLKEDPSTSVPTQTADHPSPSKPSSGNWIQAKNSPQKRKTYEDKAQTPKDQPAPKRLDLGLSKSSKEPEITDSSNAPGINFGRRDTNNPSRSHNGLGYKLGHPVIYLTNKSKQPAATQEYYKITKDSNLGSVESITNGNNTKIVLCEGVTSEIVKVIPRHVQIIIIDGDVSPDAMAALRATVEYVIIGNRASAKAIAAIPYTVKVIGIISKSPEYAVKAIPSHIKTAIVNGKLKDSLVYAIPVKNIEEYRVDREFIGKFTDMLSQFCSDTACFRLNFQK